MSHATVYTRWDGNYCTLYSILRTHDTINSCYATFPDQIWISWYAEFRSKDKLNVLEPHCGPHLRPVTCLLRCVDP